jgi:hypothetical protein
MNLCLYAALVLLVVQPASAQTMYKCQNAGKVEYSNRPCSSGEEVKRIAPDAVATPPRQTPPDRSVAATEPSAAAFPGVVGTQPANPSPCYMDADIREIDVSIASPSLPVDAREFFMRERLRVTSCKLGRLPPEARQARSQELRGVTHPDKTSRQASINRVDSIYAQFATPSEANTAAIERSAAAIEKANRSNRNIYINGKPYIPVKGGVIEPSTGKFCPQSGNTYFCN